MPTIYVIDTGDYEDNHVVGVHATLDGAKKAVEARVAADDRLRDREMVWFEHPDAHGWIYHPRDPKQSDMDTSYHITPYELGE